ncbi:MAG: PilZ domain-containing protein [Planctomycetota bacterium]
MPSKTASASPQFEPELAEVDGMIRSYLAEPDWDAAVQRIEYDRRHAPSYVERERRAGGRRHVAVINCLVRFARDGAPHGIALVRTRNISAGGVSVIHGQALPIGTACQLAIEATHGQGVVMKATVARSREVNGADLSQAGFEIGLAFAEPIDISAFTRGE